MIDASTYEAQRTTGKESAIRELVGPTDGTADRIRFEHGQVWIDHEDTALNRYHQLTGQLVPFRTLCRAASLPPPLFGFIRASDVARTRSGAFEPGAPGAGRR